MAKLRRIMIAALLAFVSVACAILNPVPPTLYESSFRDYSLPGYGFRLTKPLSGWGDSRLQRLSNENDLHFAKRATQLVSEAIYHCEDVMRERFIANVTEPWARFNEIGVISPAFLRCGYCHQSAFVLAEFLRRGGVDAKVIGLEGHVVTQLTISGKTFFADPDLNVGPFEADPHSADDMRRSATAAYAVLESRFNKVWVKEFIDSIVNFYSSIEDNVEYYDTAFLQNVERAQRIILYAVAVGWHLGYILVVWTALWLVWRLWRFIRCRGSATDS